MDIVESARDIVGQLLDITPADVLSAIIERAEVSRALLSSIVENFDLEDIAENLREILANLDWDLDVHGAVDIILRQFQLDEIMQLLGKFVDELSEGAYSIVDFLDDVMWKFGIVAMFDYLEDIMTRLSIGADELINMLIDSFGVDIILQYLAEIYSRLGLEDVTDLESLFAQYSLYEIISMLGQLMSDLHMTSIQMLLALLEYYSLTDIINYASEIAGALAGISMGDILAAIIEKFEVTGTELAIIIQKFDLEAIAENLKELITELAGELNASEVLDTIMMYTTLAEIVGVLDIIVEELQEISYGIEEFFSEIIWKYSLADVVSYLNNMVNVLKISAEEAFRMILKRFGELMIFSNIEYIVSNFSVDALKAFKVILEECVIDVVVDNLVDLAGALKLSATQILSAFLDVRTIEEIISCADDIVDKLTGLTPGDLLSAIIERVTITEEILLDIVQNFDLADIVENLKEILTKLADSIGIDDALDIIMQQFGLAGIVEFLGDIISELNEISYSIDEFIADMLTRFGLNAAIAYLQEIAAALNISPLEIFNRIIEIFSLDTILGKLGDIFRELTGMNKADALVSIISSAQSLSLTMVTTILNNFDLDAVVARYTGCLPEVLKQFDKDVLMEKLGEIVSMLQSLVSLNPIQAIELLADKLGVLEVVTAVLQKFDAEAIGSYLSDIINKLKAVANPIEIIDLLLTKIGLNAMNVITAVVNQFEPSALVNYLLDLVPRLKNNAELNLIQVFDFLYSKMSAYVPQIVNAIISRFSIDDIVASLTDLISRLKDIVKLNPAQIIEMLLGAIDHAALVRAVMQVFGSETVTAYLEEIMDLLEDILPDDLEEAAVYLMQQFGFTVEQMAKALVELFDGISIDSLKNLFDEIFSYDSDLYKAFSAIYEDFKDAFPNLEDAREFAAKMLNDVGRTVNDIAMLFEIMYIEAGEAAKALSKIFNIEEVAKTVGQVYELAESALRSALQHAGYVLDEINDVIESLRDFFKDLFGGIWPF